ncbi:invasin domain 3-containing protein (plasmid) [Hafnia alvei]|uniref:inverse autotransporter beta domain-containing protein n=1 Tax=Hafnia alvei TaxID=569 RepID=UPI0028BF4572|nr:inverse autotransporter beta domain-containing protein [Hafnia alvei]WNN54758.1 invasin domain 3-containing protein [Hafnia alvei]
MFSKLRLRKGIAYLLIWLQLLTPGLSMLPMVARASEPADMQSTVQGLNALILGNEAPAPKVSAPSVTRSQAPTTSAPTASSRLSDYFHVQAPAATPAPETGLPSLTSPKSSTDKAGADESATSSTRGDEGDNRLASGAMQMGSLLSQDNTSDAAINYARSIGEGLINQQVNDWLNQYGNAKVSLGTHQNVSGDLLVPLTETDKSLVFSQVGARTNQDRNTVNLGFGYRQYLNDWMLGINTFYDYDYTGKNKRIGVGTEAWTDYLKLAANGYIRQTNWHQSKLDDMEDYDERPANGFDLRANAYLPSWPNWGGSLKYEQYFGKGVSVAESASPDSLKDNPVVVTAGVDYTPFPLMTLSAKRSIGDSNETNVGLDFTYRFGVPWEQQIDPDSVGLMRSLVGSKYDFVDRNYNIVMQYRKQELLTISLPAATTAQAAETVPVILTVSKAKYGLKSVSWNVDATLTARGGRYQQVSPTELRVTLPAYVFGQRTNAAQNYKISAVATDNNGNQSNTAETLIGVVPSENTVSNLTISPSDKDLPANDSESYTLTGTVTDGKGAPLTNQKVTFSVTGLINAAGQAGTTLAPVGGGKGDSRQLTVTTGMDGKATITLRSKVAGEGKITATMDNGNSSTAKATFVADSTTAAVTALVVEDDNATADGKATNSVLITVKDKFGNPVNGADVYLTASNEAKIVNKVATNAQGSAKVTLTSTKAGPSTVAASLNDSQKEVTVTFGVGKPDQDKSGISTDKSDYVAGDDIAVSVVLKDGQNNSISGKSGLLTDSAVTVPNAVVKSGSKWVEETQSPGTYTRHYVAKTASVNQHATLNLTGWSKTSNAYNITANMKTAAVVSLEVKDNNAVADGTAKNSVIVTVEDNYQNRVTGAVVSLAASNGALIAESETTGPAGTVLVTLTNAKAGVSAVSASLNSSSKSVNVSFGVGEPVKANSSITTNKASYISGSEIQIEVTLADQKQNAVAGLNSTKLNSMVTVANAEAKSTTNWVESSTAGRYVGTYVAKVSGENLTATLKISDGNTASEMYAITAGEAVLANSSITRDSASYVSGTDIKVTVTLKDGNSTPNPVTGLSSATLSDMVTVANAKTKSAANWTEVADKPGTYTGLYVANTVGTGLKATLTIAGVNKSSATYAITAGEAVQAGAKIATNAGSYVAGAEMTVTVTLKDGQGNGVTGQKATLTAEGTTLTVANATAKADSEWADNNDGTYSRTYIANTVGSNLTASVKLTGWTAAVSSSAYAITQGSVVQAGAKIATNAGSYVAGSEMTVTVTLKDGQGNGVTGQKATLTAQGTTLTVANATAKADSAWIDNSNGTYSRTYIANTVGSNLKATLTLSGWTATTESAAYTITQGSVVQAGAKIATNAGSYVAGAEMTVTVTLKDGQGNGATGQAALLTSSAVTIANATAKADSVWTDNNDGTYNRTYIANTVGSNLKATLKLTGWTATTESAAYTITQGSVVQAGAKIATNESSYVAGSEMTMTVTLKDGQGNGVTGQAALLTSTTVKVPNATAKADSAWADNGDGTYSRTYIANTVGSNLKATLKLTGWTATTESAAYTITQGSVVQAGAKIATNAGSYVAGAEMTVTVTLKDGQGNGATGQAALLTSSAVTIANATAKADSVWADNNDGTYSRTYIATTVGSNLKATLTLSGWTATTESAAYTITQGSVVQAGAKIATNAGSYVAGAEMTVTVTLKDAQGNGTTGQTALLTSSAVTVANATAKADGVWADNNDGTYSRTYIATTVGSNLTASVKLSNWSTAVSSSAYVITQGSVVQAGAKIATNAGSYVAGSEMTMTVTLKDGQGNGVTGQAALLTSTTVKVPNATAKADSVWADKGDGTYSRTYIATTVGSNLKATLTLSGWTAAVESAAYAITQGSVVQAGAKIATNESSYVAGTEMMVTVTLKDGQGNGATGQAALLTSTTVKVPNATAKADSAWADNGDGTYNRTYIANTVGSNLKATLKLTGWTATTESAAYTITQGSVVQAGAKIATNAGSYVAGTEMTVTVTLKDAQGNGTTGQAALLTSTTVGVANATAKADSVWADNNDGTYSRTYIATTVGSNLKATLTLSGWTATTESAAYTITQGSVVQAGAKIATNAGSYVAGAEMTVTVTLKDAQGNGTTGQTALLTSSAVTVANATAKADGVWADNNDGTYSRTYIATTVGSNLTASVKLSNWSTAVSSSAYVITQGSVVQAGAKIATNAGSYVAGSEMTMTVTLKDGQGNGVTGQAALLTSTTVKVPNATAKADSVWADKGDGTYSRTYIATTVGSNLKATLTLSGWTAAVESAAYAITQGSVVQAGAKIATNESSYVAGTEMMVTVTLKDGQGNGATGQAALLTSTTVKVPNATAKADSAWADNGDGTYNRTYIANTVGSNLKATLKLTGWTATTESAAYTITQGSVVQAGAKIATNAGSYVAGTEMTVTVTLKDAQGNGTTGQAALLTSTTVGVANATAKADSVWADNNDGTYSRTYIATTVGSNLKATLTLSGWTAAVSSSAYAITQGSVVQAGAKIATDESSYVAGSEMTMTVTLKDGQGNGVTGQAALLTSTTVKVPNATAKADSAWADNGDGTYNRTYIANTVGSNLTASLKLSEWNTAAESEGYTITVGSASEVKLSVVTNNSIANGIKDNVVKAIVYDSQNNLVKNASLKFEPVTNLTITPSGTVTDDNGEMTANIHTVQSGPYTISVSLNDTEVKSSVEIYFTIDPDASRIIAEAFNPSAVVASADLCQAGKSIKNVPESARTGIDYRIALKVVGADGEPVYASGSSEDKIVYSIRLTVVSGNIENIFLADDTGVGGRVILAAVRTNGVGGSGVATVVSNNRVWMPRICATAAATVVMKPYVTIKGKVVNEVSPEEGVTLDIK